LVSYLFAHILRVFRVVTPVTLFSKCTYWCRRLFLVAGWHRCPIANDVADALCYANDC